MTSDERKYRQAAIAYFVYGLIYLTGAIHLSRIGETARGMDTGGVWWFVVGAAMVVGLPILIWKGYKWVTRVLAVLVFVRILGLLRLIIFERMDSVPFPWGGQLPKAYGAAAFAVVALAAFLFLVRAGWPRRLFQAQRE